MAGLHKSGLMTEGNVLKDEWNTVTHQQLVLVQHLNRVINTGTRHGFRAVIHLCDTGTADTPGRPRNTAITESADGHSISERYVHVLSKSNIQTRFRPKPEPQKNRIHWL